MRQKNDNDYEPPDKRHFRLGLMLPEILTTSRF
jgi:hypothetical protein